MKEPCELEFSINNQTVLLKFDFLEYNPTAVNYVHLPAFDLERIMINKMLRARYSDQGIPSSEIPLEPFSLGYSFNDLVQDLSVISRAVVKISADSFELTLSLLEEIVGWHVSKYGRLMRNDLETYATICVCVTIANKSSEFLDFQEKQVLYDKVCKAIREKYYNVYQHTDLIQL